MVNGYRHFAIYVCMRASLFVDMCAVFRQVFFVWSLQYFMTTGSAWKLKLLKVAVLRVR